MKNIMRGLVVFTAMLVLAGCVGRKVTHYTYIPPTAVEGQQCVKQCKQSRQTCKKLCNRGNGACMSQARAGAQKEFADYQRQRRAHNKPVDKTVNDFFEPNSCVSKECGCESDFSACYEMCGGQAVPHYG